MLKLLACCWVQNWTWVLMNNPHVTGWKEVEKPGNLPVRFPCDLRDCEVIAEWENAGIQGQTWCDFQTFPAEMWLLDRSINPRPCAACKQLHTEPWSFYQIRWFQRMYANNTPGFNDGLILILWRVVTTYAAEMLNSNMMTPPKPYLTSYPLNRRGAYSSAGVRLEFGRGQYMQSICAQPGSNAYTSYMRKVHPGWSFSNKKLKFSYFFL